MNNMSKLWSEENKPIQVLTMAADVFDGDPVTDIVNVSGFKRATFIIVTGASVAANGVVTVLAGISNASCATAIIFKYRTQLAAVPDAAGSDVMSALTAAGVDGFTMTESKGGAMYIIEVDIREVAEGGTQYDHLALKVTEGDDVPQLACVLCILSEPRYETLKTAID